MTSRGLARAPRGAKQAPGVHAEGRSELAKVASARGLPVHHDPVDRRKGNLGFIGKLSQRPAPPVPQVVDAVTTRVRVFDTRHSHSIPQNGIKCKGCDDTIPQNGTYASGTIGDVATTKPHAEYIRALRPYIEELVRLGIDAAPTTTLWHFTSDRPGVKPTLKAAEAIRSVIQARMPGVDIPPPAVAVRSDDHFRWIVLGEWLQENDPHTFARLLERVGDIKKGRAAQLALGTVDQTHDPAGDL